MFVDIGRIVIKNEIPRDLGLNFSKLQKLSKNIVWARRSSISSVSSFLGTNAEAHTVGLARFGVSRVVRIIRMYFPFKYRHRTFQKTKNYQNRLKTDGARIFPSWGGFGNFPYISLLNLSKEIYGKFPKTSNFKKSCSVSFQPILIIFNFLKRSMSILDRKNTSGWFWRL